MCGILRIVMLFGILIPGVNMYSQDEFITVWKTGNEGDSGDDQVNIATYNGFLFDIYWEEVANTSNSGYQLGDFGYTTITFPNPGTYRVKISPGIGVFNDIKTDDSGDRLKLVNIEQWGTIVWVSMFSTFAACSNLTNLSATDAPDLSNVISLEYMFSDCSQLVHIPGLENWDVSHALSLVGMFQADSLFNQDIGGWDVSNVAYMNGMFFGAWNFDQDLSAWNVNNVSDMTGMFQEASAFNHPLGAWQLRTGVSLDNMLNQSGMDCINYSKTLLGWAGNPGTPNNLTFGAADVDYLSDATESRNTLLSKGWTITDGLEEADCPYMRDPCITIWKFDSWAVIR